jgi:lysine 6-dehydrogenase
MLDIEHQDDVQTYMRPYDIAISAVPYPNNYRLAKSAIATQTHFIDLGGNNSIVQKERELYAMAKNNGVTIIPDCGLAPGLTSVITKDIVEQMDHVAFAQLRVGGLPLHPKPPLKYQIVFSPYGLINEYVEDALILDHGNIETKKSMTELERIQFPPPFGELEAFLTSGGSSTLPYTYKNIIDKLDYKTIRYPGHCEKFKTLLDLGFAEQKKIKIGNDSIIPREMLVSLLLHHLPQNEKDVVLLKVVSEGQKNQKKVCLQYQMIDYYDESTGMTAMMRTTGYPVSIITQMLEQRLIKQHGVFCPEEIIPCKPFFDELKKRQIIIHKKITHI